MSANKGLPTGWTWEVWQDGTRRYLYDPTVAQLRDAPRWVDAKGYMNPAALLKGELGFITGPVYRADDKI